MSTDISSYLKVVKRGSSLEGRPYYLHDTVRVTYQFFLYHQTVYCSVLPIVDLSPLSGSFPWPFRSLFQTHNFLWGIGLSAGILLIVGIGSLVLYKLKRR